MALPGCLGLGLLSWAAAFGLVGRLSLGCHGGHRCQWRPAWEPLAPGLGVWVDLHPMQEAELGYFVPLK